MTGPAPSRRSRGGSPGGTSAATTEPCECDPETSCYGCLCNFPQPVLHGQLQRGYALAFLDRLVKALLLNGGAVHPPAPTSTSSRRGLPVVLDTRNGTGGFSAPVEADKVIALQVTGWDGVPATGVTAVVLNLTATGPTAASYVTTYTDGQARPAAGSNLNFTRGETIPTW